MRERLAGLLRRWADRLHEPEARIWPNPEGGYTIALRGVTLARIEPGHVVDQRPPMPRVPGDDQPSIVCPECGARSYHPGDIAEGYCGRCHDWTSPPIGVRLPREHWGQRASVTIP